MKDIVGSIIKQLRTSTGLSQVEFAKAFNQIKPLNITTTQADICRYETGRVSCPATKLLKFQVLAAAGDVCRQI